MVGALYCNIKIRLKLGTNVTRNDYRLSEDTSKNLMRLNRCATGKTFSSDGTFANLALFWLININIQMSERLLEKARFFEQVVVLE